LAPTLSPARHIAARAVLPLIQGQRSLMLETAAASFILIEAMSRLQGLVAG